MHRVHDIQRRETVVRSRSRLVSTLSEDRRAGTVGSRDARYSEGTSRSLRSPSRGDLFGCRARGRRGSFGKAPQGPAPPGQGDRRARRSRRGAEAVAHGATDDDDRGRSGRADHREDGAGAGADRIQRRQTGAAAARCRARTRDLRPGRGDRGRGVVDQAVALRAALAGEADRKLPVRGSRPVSARQSWLASWRGSSGWSSSVSTCPSTWRSMRSRV